MIDSSCVRVHQHGAAPKKTAGMVAWDRSRGGLTTKIHALVDAEGRPIRLMLTPGQAGDAPVGLELATGLKPGAILLADNAYVST